MRQTMIIPPKCLYNHEMLILFTSETPYQSYRDPVTDAQARGYVRELADTQVDALMCCPTAWRAVLWPSDVDPRWRTEDLDRTPPAWPCDMKYFEKAYWRARQYMITGADPLRVTRDTAREIGLAFFISYRMNDHHHLWVPDCPTHDRFWREHPEYHIHPDRTSYFNYLHQEVRDYYAALLTELVERYDPEGLELDFMRSPHFFPADRVDEGLEAMTTFVRRMRTMLDRNSRSGGRKLLGVRVPRSIGDCMKAGLDVPRWDRERLVDMVNVSSFFISTHEVDIEGFRAAMENARIYGEMHFITEMMRAMPSGYRNNVSQKTTPVQYETMAHEFWQRGVDGLSFFNFAYCREHQFGEPRRRGFPGVEPPFETLKRIGDREFLAPRPKHYVINSHFDTLPVSAQPGCSVSFGLDVNLAPETTFEDGLLRIENDGDLWGLGVRALLNGQELVPSRYVGELFAPFTRESLPDMRTVETYAMPPDLVRPGRNEITIVRDVASPAWRPLTCRRAELALYPYRLPGCMV